jgi:hypothetical protein
MVPSASDATELPSTELPCACPSLFPLPNCPPFVLTLVCREFMLNSVNVGVMAALFNVSHAGRAALAEQPLSSIFVSFSLKKKLKPKQ